MAVALNENQVVNTTMNYKGYTASMIFDPEDRVIVVDTVSALFRRGFVRAGA